MEPHLTRALSPQWQGSRSVECVVGGGWDGRYRQGSTQLVLD